MLKSRRRAGGTTTWSGALLAFACLLLPRGAAAVTTVASLVIGSVVEPTHPEVGEQVSIAFDLSALGNAGLPAYRLLGAEDLFAGELDPEPHGGGFPDRVVFELTALRPGVADIQLHVDYEAEHCDAGHCYYAFRSQLSSVVRVEVGTGEPAEDLPDLVPTRVERLSTFPSCPPEGVYFCVENRGVAAASGFQILLHAVGGESTVRFVSELDPGADICLAFFDDEDVVSDEPGQRLEVFVDSMHEVAESDEGNNRVVFDVPSPAVPPGGCPTPTPTPSAFLRIDPPGLTMPCDGSFDVSISVDGPLGESVTVETISFHHGYSQGDYGTGFHWDLDAIELPLVLAAGEHLTIPVTYSVGGAFNSRLHVDVGGTSSSGGGVSASSVYYGRLCRTQTPIATRTPTPTPTPLPPGDLGLVPVHGVVYDAAHGPEASVPSALVSFRVLLRPDSYQRSGQASADDEGLFAFSVQLYDTDTIEIRVDAPGYRTQQLTLAALDSADDIEIALQPLAPADAVDCEADCNGDLQVDIAELVRSVAIALGESPVDQCSAADPGADGTVSIAELVAGVGNAIEGCP